MTPKQPNQVVNKSEPDLVFRALDLECVPEVGGEVGDEEEHDGVAAGLPPLSCNSIHPQSLSESS